MKKELCKRESAIHRVCIIYLGSYRLPKVIVLVHFSEKGGTVELFRHLRSVFLFPLSGYLLWKLNFPELSGLLPLFSSELTGVGGHMQREAFLQAGSVTRDTMPLALRLGSVGPRQNNMCTCAQMSPSHCWSAWSLLKCLLS